MRRAAQVADRIVVEAELRRLLPAAVHHRLAIADDVAAQRQDQREGVLRDSRRRIAADVRDDDAALAAGRDVEGVEARRRDADHLQVRQLVQVLAPDADLVADGDLGALQPLDDLVGRRPVVVDPFVLEAGLGQLDGRRHRAAVEKDDAAHVPPHAAHSCERPAVRSVHLSRCRPCRQALTPPYITQRRGAPTEAPGQRRAPRRRPPRPARRESRHRAWRARRRRDMTGS